MCRYPGNVAVCTSDSEGFEQTLRCSGQLLFALASCSFSSRARHFASIVELFFLLPRLQQLDACCLTDLHSDGLVWQWQATRHVIERSVLPKFGPRISSSTRVVLDSTSPQRCPALPIAQDRLQNVAQRSVAAAQSAVAPTRTTAIGPRKKAKVEHFEGRERAR